MTAIDRAFIRAYELDEQDEHAAVAPSAAARKPAPLTPQASVAPAPPAPHFRIYREPNPAPAPRTTTAAVSATSERRPLSSFGPPAPSVEAKFRPSHEVDAYRWSCVVEDLFHNHKVRWQAVVQTLLAADDVGCSLIGIAGAAPGVGATTATACIARLLVEAGKSVAIVDADFAEANLAASLGLVVEIGWEDVLAGRVPLAEAVVESTGDRIALVPLMQGGVPAAEKLDGIQASVTAGVLRYHYDIVLFDLGDMSDVVQGPIARRVARQCRLDGAVLITGGQARAVAAGQRAMHAAPELAAVCLGVVENQLRTA